MKVDIWWPDLHSVGAKLAYKDTQLKALKYAMKQNSDILWYPIKNVDTQFTKKRCVFTQWPQILIWSYGIYFVFSYFSYSSFSFITIDLVFVSSSSLPLHHLKLFGTILLYNNTIADYLGNWHVITFNASVINNWLIFPISYLGRNRNLSCSTLLTKSVEGMPV